MTAPRRRPHLIALLLASVALLSAAVRPAAADEYYGINAGGLVFGMPPADRDRHLALMRDAGISMIRTDASWSGVEPAPPLPGGEHVYLWWKFDAVVSAMATHGLRWYPMLGYSAPWAAALPPDVMSPPADPADYAAYVAAFARRYGRDGTFWAEHPGLPRLPVQRYEIWNEPNYDRFWKTQHDAPQRYAELYVAARAALRAVDPTAKAVVGGLIDSDSSSFVRRMYAHRPDLRGNVDAVGFHPYQQVGGVLGSIARMRAALVKAGDPEVPIELTEIGWFEGERSEQSRARLLRTLVRTLPTSSLNVTSVLPYVWTGGPYQLVHEDGTPMPAGAAYAQAIRAMTGPQAVTIGRAVATFVRNASSVARRGRASRGA